MAIRVWLQRQEANGAGFNTIDALGMRSNKVNVGVIKLASGIPWALYGVIIILSSAGSV